MTTIPYDPGLVLGNIIQPERIENLMAIADKQKPQIAANETLKNLLRSTYKLRLIYQMMINQKVDIDTLDELHQELETLKDETAEAAVELATATITAENEIFELKKSQGQTTITKNIESPIDYYISSIKQFELSFDSLNFDVQFFRKEEVDDSSNAHASAISGYAAQSQQSWGGYSQDSAFCGSYHSTAVSQSQNHDIEGTIVITANCTHKMADVFAPLVLDPRKTMEAWNYTFEDDFLDSDPRSVFEAAMETEEGSGENGNEINKLSLLSGVTKGSSFVGYVHILRRERTQSTQRASSTAAAVRSSIRASLWVDQLTGGSSATKSSAKTAASMLSNSSVENQVNLIVQGCLPSIVANDVPSTVKRLKPSPEAIMSQLQAISGASNDSVNKSPAASASDARTGAQFATLNNEHQTRTIEKVEEVNTEHNKVIDCASMMQAFTDYVQKCHDGQCGIPINFYIKQLTKADVAKCYIRRFYPNGASSAEAARKGQFGQEPTT